MGARLGLIAAVIVAGAFLLPLSAVAWRAEGWGGLDPSD